MKDLFIRRPMISGPMPLMQWVESMKALAAKTNRYWSWDISQSNNKVFAGRRETL